MADTDTKDPTDQVGSYEDDLAKRSTRDQQQDKEANGPTPEKPKNEAGDTAKKGKIRKGISAVRDPLKTARDKVKNLDPREKIRNLQKQMSPSQLAKKGAEKLLKEGAKKAVVAAASNPVGLIIIIVVIFILAIIIVIITGGSAGGLQNKELQITKTGPDSAINGAELDYQINLAFAGTATDIIIKDPLPAGTEFISSGQKSTCDNGACNQASRTVIWNLKDIVPLQGGILSNVSTALSLKLKATADDSTLVNQAQGEVIGAGALPVNPPGGGGPNNPPNTSSNDFDTLMAGQGRNTGILGDRASFIAAVLKNGSGLAGGFSSGQYSDQLGQIYDSAVSKNVNPLIITTIWGVEASFELNNTEFGCMPFGSGFAKQMSCSVNTINNLMAEFDDLKSKGPVYLAGCPTFTDGFLYAYEYYTPVCHASDGNDASHKNFVTIFKQLYGK